MTKPLIVLYNRDRAVDTRLFVTGQFAEGWELYGSRDTYIFQVPRTLCFGDPIYQLHTHLPESEDFLAWWGEDRVNGWSS